MLEIAPGRFINRKRVVGANIYQKDGKIRVAIELDTVNKEAATAFSGELANDQEARNLIGNLVE